MICFKDNMLHFGKDLKGLVKLQMDEYIILATGTVLGASPTVVITEVTVSLNRRCVYRVAISRSSLPQIQ